MKEFIDAYEYCKANKRWTLIVFAITVLAAAIGAYSGVLAYYNGWLG